MKTPHQAANSSPTSKPIRPLKPSQGAQAEGPSVPEVSLSAVPVDAMQVYVRWRVTPAGLDLAGLRREAAISRLALRFFHRGGGHEDFALETGLHERLFTLQSPREATSVGIIVKGAGDAFDLLTHQSSLTMPDPADTSPAPLRAHQENPSTPSKPSTSDPIPLAPPKRGRSSSNRPVDTDASERPSAPISLEATLRMHGRVAPGYRLRLAGEDLKPAPNGDFHFARRLSEFATSWILLQDLEQAHPDTAAEAAATLTEASGEAPVLVVHGSLEITGVLREPAYRRLLPASLELDPAGCFRIVQPLPAGAAILPHIVLIPTGSGPQT